MLFFKKLPFINIKDSTKKEPNIVPNFNELDPKTTNIPNLFEQDNCVYCHHDELLHDGDNSSCGHFQCDCIRFIDIKFKKPDMVNHPAHYTDSKIEVWDYIIDKNLTYCLGNVVKYVSRAGKKGGLEQHLEDLKKAQAYLKREIERVEAGE